MRWMKMLPVLTVLLSVVGSEAREWTDASRNQTIEADFVECKVTLRLPNGRKKIVDMRSLSEGDRDFVIETLRKQVAATVNAVQVGKPAVAGNAPKAQIAKPGMLAANGKQQHTEFGSIKLSEEEIKRFFADLKARKGPLIEILQNQLNHRAEKMSPTEIQEFKAMFKYLSQDNVLIVDRSGTPFKVMGPGDNPYFLDYGIVKTVKIIDNNSAYVKINNTGERDVILEGIDTNKLPKGEWNCRFLLKEAGKRKMPATFGNLEVDLFQAISDEGFPKDVILW
jgi:hypothetical protein